jgi:hypothetical protein
MSFPINYTLRNEMISFLEKCNYPQIISREKILDGIRPNNESHHRRSRGDPIIRDLRKEISRHMAVLGYTTHCQSDKNRVFRKCEEL